MARSGRGHRILAPLLVLLACTEGPLTQPEGAELQAPRTAAGEAAPVGAEEAMRALRAAADHLARTARILGSAPTEAQAAALAEARGLLRQGRAALEAGRHAAAKELALRCLALSRRLLESVRGGDDTSPSAVARQAIAQASAYLRRAHHAVGDTPTPGQRSALREARSLLAEARAAFEAGRYRVAYGLAGRSAAISRRILHSLGG